MNGAAIKILTAAAEAVGGRQKLAARLGIGPSLLARFISGRLETPDSVLLQAMDIVLASRDPLQQAEFLAAKVDIDENLRDAQRAE